ncbi:hypothetical protein EI427_00865 [Flammeovirga pectinis]|uniref:TonB C-terminal domain-containing protein n=1 Tax=Flammeovirga pectinis TaxID=2494373 RepID=A0A3S9NXX4_9BACT|nr:hypothetical protein [Flammeovirga pectinis]AZQ60811.1 hypothetical protein EI427_00865 [Flammeovirga pectinis]
MTNLFNRLFVFLWLINHATTFAQTEVGHLYDAGGNAIHGYLDPFTCITSNTVFKKIPFDYNRGYYYNNQDQIGYAFLKIAGGQFSILGANNVRKTLDEADYKSMVIGQDSFFLAKNINFKDQVKKPTLVQNITTIDSIAFAKFYKEQKTYFIQKSNKQTQWTVLKKNNSNLGRELLPLFKKVKGDNNFRWPFSFDKKKDFNRKSFDNILNYIKMVERYSTQEKQYFDKNFNPTNHPQNFTYYSLVNRINSESYTELFYDFNQQLLYSVSFRNSSLGQLHGRFKMFVDGILVKDFNYKEGKLELGRVYKDKKLVYTVRNKVIIKRGVEENIEKIYYKGEKSENGEIDFIDPFKKNKYKKEIKNDNITFSAYMKDNIFYEQTVNFTNPLNLKSVNWRFNDFFSKSFLLKNPYNNKLFVYAIINQKGYVESYKFLNSVDTAFDNEIDKFIKMYLLYDSPKKTKIRSKNRKLGMVETVIPFEIQSTPQWWQTYKYTTNWMLINHQMHFDMMNQQMNTTKPTMPTFK